MNNSHEICFVTGNSDKSRDGLAILGDLYHQVRIVPIDLPEIQGEPDEIAITKAKEALKHSNGLPVIVEDSSLCINAFGGMPGPFIKFFLRKIKIQDLHLMLQSYEDKSASALSTIAIATSPEHVYVFQHKTRGKIVAPKGSRGDLNGFDPCFMPDGSSKTLAEMDQLERSNFCARWQVMQKLRAAIIQHIL